MFVIKFLIKIKLSLIKKIIIFFVNYKNFNLLLKIWLKIELSKLN